MSEQHLNTGAAALGALEPAELAAFEEHLLTCATCREELAGFRETLVRLAATTESTPSPDLRQRLLEQMNRTPQLPPLTSAVAEVDDQRDEASPKRDEVTQTLNEAPALPPELQGPLAPPLPLARRRRRLTWVVAAAAAIAIATPSGILLARNNTPDQTAQCLAQASDVTLLLPLVGDGGRIEHSEACAAAVVSMPPMPAAPDGQVYQLWVIDADHARPVGLVASDQQLVLAGLDDGDIAVGVTLEPGPAGSAVPSSDPIWMVEL